MSEISKNEQLIHALLDGDLNPSETEKARALMKSDPSMGRLLEQYRAQKEDLSQLPRFTLPESFSDRVLNAAKEVAPVVAPEMAWQWQWQWQSQWFRCYRNRVTSENWFFSLAASCHRRTFISRHAAVVAVPSAK